MQNVVASLLVAWQAYVASLVILSIGKTPKPVRPGGALAVLIISLAISAGIFYLWAV